MALFGKPLAALNVGDIERLVAEGWPESDTLELKSGLPQKDGGRDPWQDGRGDIGDYPRNQLLAEVIAFANAHGGHLVVGILESEDRPKRAAGISSLQRCAELAERLRLMARDQIEPQIPRLGIIEVPTDNEGNGVIVFDIPQSQVAPHRLCATRECLIRRADRSEKMTMREIQDLTLAVAQRHNQRERQFARLRGIAESVPAPTTAEGGGVLSMHLNAVPVDSGVYLPRSDRESIAPDFGSRHAVIGENIYPIYLPGGHLQRRPILRGMRWSVADRGQVLNAYEDGCAAIVHHLAVPIDSRPEEADENALVAYPGWLVGFFACAIGFVHAIRVRAGVPDLEYGLEFRVSGTGPMYLWPFGTNRWRMDLRQMEPGPFSPPIYSLGEIDGANELVSLMTRDLFDSAGFPGDVSLTIEPPPWGALLAARE